MRAPARVDVEAEAPAWRAALPDAEELARQAAEAALADVPDGLVTILLTDDDTVQALNARFRGADKPTNVLAFPAAPAPAGAGRQTSLGDIALAFGVCASEAGAQGKTLADHLRHLVIHGVLHLLGCDHQEEAEAEAMESRERALLAGLGVADPYAADHAAPASADA